MDEQLVTREDLAPYATYADLGYINERVDALQEQTIVDRDRFEHEIIRANDIIGTLGETVSALEYQPMYYNEINRMNDEITQIKEALLEVQDTLRQIGLDDMSQRLGDLNLLLT